MGRIPDKVRDLVYKRDGGRCVHCGATEGLGLQHRINKGVGGSKLLDIPSNLLTFCNIANAALESDPEFAERGRQLGWKLSRWDDPTKVRFFDVLDAEWFHLTNTFARQRAI